ncbi:MAG: hypothetical protein E6K80_01655 [Candidatus Eisenbacteria bacterium]|uniref:non-specific serine/threonine protein kinase n=1 Tax=Eiseniibacteriota bacterium TaxID=2212470 RepID=A0A538UAI0_UNCEI|nr:MAG: hypothetical protein E6K80_01655 [Candidatus Eisenbacteria bacterium]
MPLSAGTRLGPYEITAPLGAGGMGEVYRARDTRLLRDVAVKVLPSHLSSSPEVRSRFEREARTVSSLNHPHICILHDVGREGDTDYLVMELVEGETLAQRLTRGALAPMEVVRLGAQIADALERAHRAGVIHRDLKPGNIMLTKSGPKLMDFGLARASGPLGGPSSGSVAMTQSPTMAQPLTAEGTIVGTFQYMAPEQLEGKEADARSDVWALGCVLYEMATGRRAFEGKSQASLISAIMTSEPEPLVQLAPMSPPALERLARACLAKDPEERVQTAHDVKLQLQWIAEGSSAAGVPAPVAARRRSREQRAWILVATLAAALTALMFAWAPWSARDQGPPLARFMLASPEGATLTSPANAELSPDGRTIAYEASDSAGTTRVYLRPLATPETRAIRGTDGGSLPFWAPDSRTIGFFSRGKLRKVALDGSPPVALCDAPDARGGAWSRMGVIVFAPNNQGGLERVSENGGAPTPITQPNHAKRERGHRYPQFLPDQKHFLFVAIGQEDLVSTYATSVDGERSIEVCRGGSGARWAPPGWLLYLENGITSSKQRLFAKRFDPARRRASGEPQLVLDDVQATNFGYANVTADARGTLVAQHWEAPPSRLQWRDVHGVVLGTAAAAVEGAFFALSPDGRRVAHNDADQINLFTLDLATRVSTRLTFGNQLTASAVWSRDGRRIAFASGSGARGWEIHVKSADGSGPDSLLFHGPGLFSFPMSWSVDGRWLVAQCADTSGSYDLWKIPMDGSGSPQIYERTPEAEQNAELSPDGRWLLYGAVSEGKQALYVQSFPNPGTKYQVAIEDVLGAKWSAQGDRIFVLDPRREALSIPVSFTGGFQQGPTTRMYQLPPNEAPVGVAPDHRLLTATAQDISASTRFEVVLGWPGLLGKR